MGSPITEWRRKTYSSIRDPEKFFSRNRKKSYAYLIAFAAASIIVPTALISFFIVMLFGELSLGQALIGSTGFGALIWLWFLIDVSIIHVLVKILGGEKNLRTTFEALTYPSILLALGLIPVLNIGAGIYLLYLNSKALSLYQEVSMGKAVAARIVTGLIDWIVVIAAILVLGLAIGGIVNTVFPPSTATVSTSGLNYTSPPGYQQANYTEGDGWRAYELEKTSFENIIVQIYSNTSQELFTAQELTNLQGYMWETENEAQFKVGDRQWAELNLTTEIEGLTLSRHILGTIHRDRYYAFDMRYLGEDDAQTYSKFRETVFNSTFKE